MSRFKQRGPQRTPQPQMDPNVVPEFKARAFGVKLAAEMDLTVATNWLNEQLVAGWQLTEFNKLVEGDELLVLLVLVRAKQRQVIPVEGVPTVYEERG